jgi:hypothetical protein
VTCLLPLPDVLRVCRCVVAVGRDAKFTDGLKANLHDLIDDTAVEATHLVFSFVGDKNVRKVSFDQFGQWYNSKGFVVLPWLELLDLSKWPFRAGSLQAVAASTTTAAAAAASTAVSGV